LRFDVLQDGILLGAGLTLMHGMGFSLAVDYQGNFRSDYRSHAVSAELRYVF
jgi:uncharacterized protein with beta-barrel porin domain